MPNIFTLDSIRAEMEEKFAPVVISLGEEEITLRNVMRLLKEERNEVDNLMKAMSKDDDEELDYEEWLETLAKILTIVAEKDGEKLIEAIGDDPAVLIHIYKLWNGAENVGEASNSPE